MPKFVSPKKDKKIPNVVAPTLPELPKFTNLLNPFESSWIKKGAFSYRRKNWYKKEFDAKVDSINLPPPGADLPRILHYCADQGGCAFWRMIFPGNELLAQNKAVVQTMYQMIKPDSDASVGIYDNVYAVELQRQCTEHQGIFIKELRQLSNKLKSLGRRGFRIIYSVDDVINGDDIPTYNVCKKAFVDPTILNTVKDMVQYCDEMIVQSEYLADHYRKILNYDRVSVIPNYVPKYWFDKGTTHEYAMNNFRKNKNKPRIMYAGSTTHFDVANLNHQRDDFHHVVDHIIRDIEVDKKYQWIFVGGFPLKLKPYIDNKTIEYYHWTSVTDYPALLKSTNANVMIAPLADNVFNNSKANIKLTEAASLHIPCVAQNLKCYNSDGWKYLFNTGNEMMATIGNIISSEESFSEAVKNAEEYVNEFWLSDNLDEWVKLYTTDYGDEKRKDNKKFYERNKRQFIK